MAHHLRLAEARQPDRAAPFETVQTRAERRRLGDVDAAMAGRILLEDQSLLDLQAAVAADGLAGSELRGRSRRAQRLAPFAHRITSRSPASSWSTSSSVTVSVAATSSRSANSGRSG